VLGYLQQLNRSLTKEREDADRENQYTPLLPQTMPQRTTARRSRVGTGRQSSPIAIDFSDTEKAPRSPSLPLRDWNGSRIGTPTETAHEMAFCAIFGIPTDLNRQELDVHGSDNAAGGTELDLGAVDELLHAANASPAPVAFQGNNQNTNSRDSVTEDNTSQQRS
jgi:hypothetical protein